MRGQGGIRREGDHPPEGRRAAPSCSEAKDGDTQRIDLEGVRGSAPRNGKGRWRAQLVNKLECGGVNAEKKPPRRAASDALVVGAVFALKLEDARVGEVCDLRHGEKVISTEAGHSLTVTSAVERSLYLPLPLPVLLFVIP